MKANELMLGDWVMLYRPRKVERIYDYGRVEVGGIEEDCDELAPIPLTSEILEKNGFTNYATTVSDRQAGNEFWYPGEEGYIDDPDLMINLMKNCFLVRCNSDIVWGLHYVHELQHALRLCGIDKEIVI